MDEKMDHGPILAQKTVSIEDNDTCPSLEQKLANLGADMIVNLLPQYIKGQIKSFEQNHDQATYVYRFKKEDGLLNLNEPADLNERKVRALWPWPGAYIELPIDGYFDPEPTSRNLKLFIRQSHVESGQFIPDQVQLEGRKKLSFEEFKRGWRGQLPRQLSSLL
jgi:methionyl-tRNA formyltransferase